MPQLTPEFERVIIYALSSTDAANFDICSYTKQMGQEVRISENYCHSDILAVDLANCTMVHVLKVSLKDVKKYELCVLVSALAIRNVC